LTIWRFRPLVLDEEILLELPDQLLASIVQPPEAPRLDARYRVATRSGAAIVLSAYTTTESASLSGSTLPQETASAGVAPDRPPVSGRASVTWMK